MRSLERQSDLRVRELSVVTVICLRVRGSVKKIIEIIGDITAE